MTRRIIRFIPFARTGIAIWLAVLTVSATNQAIAGPQHFGFGMSYLATLKQIAGRTDLVVYEAPLRAKDCAWIPRWVDNVTDFSTVVPGGIATGNFWPTDPGKEYLELISQNGTTVTIRTVNPPECFSVAQWTQLASGTLGVTTGTIVGSATGDLLSSGKDQLVLLHQNGSTLKLYVLNPPSTKTGTTWTIAKQTTMPAITGAYKGFAIGDFWGDGTQKIAVATNVAGATVLKYYSYNSSGSGSVTLITTDTATDLPVIAANGLVATDYVKDRFDVLTLIPADSATPFQIRSAPLKPGTSYNPGPQYTGKAISRQPLPGFSGAASSLVMSGTFSDSAFVPTALAAGRVFGYMVNGPASTQYSISTASDAEIAMIHRTPLKGDCPPDGWPAYGATVTWEIRIKNNGTNTIPAGAVLKWWLNTPKRSADTDPTTMDSPSGTYTIPTAIPPYDPAAWIPDPSRPLETINTSCVTFQVSCPWPYSLILRGPGATAKKVNLEAVGERWLIMTLSCAGDTNLRNNRYEAMMAGPTLRPNINYGLFVARGAWIQGNPSSTEYCYRELADAVLCMFERSGTYDNSDVLQRPYLDSIHAGIPWDLPPDQAETLRLYQNANYEGWRDQNGNCQNWGAWPRFNWGDGGEELHETTHLYQAMGDLYQYYVFPNQTAANHMADGTPVQLFTYCWFPDSFGTGEAVLGVPTMEYMKSFCIGGRGNDAGCFGADNSNWGHLLPDRTWVRILDRDGNPVPNAQVKLWGANDTTPFGTGTTDASGKWELTSLYGTSPWTDDYGCKNYDAWQNNGLTDALAYVFTVSIGSYQDQAVMGTEDFSSHSRYTLLYHSIRDRAGWTWDFRTNYKPAAPEPSFKLEAAVQGSAVQIGLTGTAGATYRLYRKWEPNYVRNLVGEYVSPAAFLSISQDMAVADSHGAGRFRAIYEVTEMTASGESLPRTIAVTGLKNARGVSALTDGRMIVAANSGIANPFGILYNGTIPYQEFLYHFRFGHTAMKIVPSRLQSDHYFATLVSSDVDPDYRFDVINPPSSAGQSYDVRNFIGDFSVVQYSTTSPYTVKLTSATQAAKFHPNDAVFYGGDIYSGAPNAFVQTVDGDTLTIDRALIPAGSTGVSLAASRCAGRPGTRYDMRELSSARGLTTIVSGGNEYIVIADTGNRRVVIWDDGTGYVANWLATDTLAKPAAVAAHPTVQNKFFAIVRRSDRQSKLYLFTFDGTTVLPDPGYPVSINVGDASDGTEMGIAAGVDPGTGELVLAVTDAASHAVRELRQVAGVWQTAATYTQAIGTFAGSANLVQPSDVAMLATANELKTLALDRTGQDGGLGVYRLVVVSQHTYTPIAPSAAKLLQDGAWAFVTGTTTAIFGSDASPSFYAENADRSSGIQVRCGGALPAINTNVTFGGALGTDPITHERFVQVSSWTAGDSQTVPALAMSMRTLGGSAYALQEGVADGSGLSNIGLLAKIAGKVTATTGDASSFCISDGSVIQDGNEPDGVKADLSAIPSASRPRPMQGDLVAVKGISTTYLQEGNVCRMVRARSASDVTNLSVVWSTFTGPGSDTTTYNHVGTDGTSLYAVFNDNTLRKYTFSQADPAAGAWTQLASPPKTVNGSNSFSDLAYQNGYLYTSAISGSNRTILRYRISDNTWQTWQNGGVDITICTTTGNGMFMDPTSDGVGYSASESSSKWVKFDWNAKTANNSWMSTSGLPGPPSGYVARGEDVATNGSGVYYATKNDTTAGLSTGDLVYTWAGLSSPTPSVLIAKPWLAGCGQSIEFVPASVSPSGNDELWMIRGADGSSSPGTGTGNPTGDWARLDLSNVSYGWSVRALPGVVRYPGEIVRIGNCVFVRGSGYNWYVSMLR